MLDQHRRWWASIKTTLCESFVFGAGWEVSPREQETLNQCCFNCWHNVYDAGPTSNQQWVNVVCYQDKITSQQTRGSHPMLLQCLPTVFDASPTLKQHRVNFPWLNAGWVYMTLTPQWPSVCDVSMRAVLGNGRWGGSPDTLHGYEHPREPHPGDELPGN